MNEIDLRILRHLEKFGPLTSRQISASTGICQNRVGITLTKFQVRYTGAKPRRYFRQVKDHGWQNGWRGKYPPLVDDCLSKNHALMVEDKGYPKGRGLDTVSYCPICCHCWHVDSSD